NLRAQRFFFAFFPDPIPEEDGRPGHADQRQSAPKNPNIRTLQPENAAQEPRQDQVDDHRRGCDQVNHHRAPAPCAATLRMRPAAPPSTSLKLTNSNNMRAKHASAAILSRGTQGSSVVSFTSWTPGDHAGENSVETPRIRRIFSAVASRIARSSPP